MWFLIHSGCKAVTKRMEHCSTEYQLCTDRAQIRKNAVVEEQLVYGYSRITKHFRGFSPQRRD